MRFILLGRRFALPCFTFVYGSLGLKILAPVAVAALLYVDQLVKLIYVKDGVCQAIYHVEVNFLNCNYNL